jgi:hypothetical protein
VAHGQQLSVQDCVKPIEIASTRVTRTAAWFVCEASIRFQWEPSMKLGLLARVATLLLAMGVLIGSCSSGSDPLTLDEYFAEVEAVDADADSQFEALFADFPWDEDAFADEANLEVFKDVVVGFPRIVGDLVDGVKDLDPPSEVEDAHDALIDAGEALIVAFDEGVDVINDAETMADVETAMGQLEPTIDGAQDVFDAACLTVVDIAIANDIHVSVTCEDE